jgi:hypothetical protein
MEKCTFCKGEGKIESRESDRSFNVFGCPACKGAGFIPNPPNGYEHTFVFTLPKKDDVVLGCNKKAVIVPEGLNILPHWILRKIGETDE